MGRILRPVFILDTWITGNVYNFPILVSVKNMTGYLLIFLPACYN